mmetsp:Transcript_24406/g.84830  ORF Transcript_24406/g.84830 Transcript_24406/m.84830 type:complete len:248 (+) Transcript_24406:603-1346(+)
MPGRPGVRRGRGAVRLRSAVRRRRCDAQLRVPGWLAAQRAHRRLRRAARHRVHGRRRVGRRQRNVRQHVARLLQRSVRVQPRVVVVRVPARLGLRRGQFRVPRLEGRRLPAAVRFRRSDVDVRVPIRKGVRRRVGRLHLPRADAGLRRDWPRVHPVARSVVPADVRVGRGHGHVRVRRRLCPQRSHRRVRVPRRHCAERGGGDAVLRCPVLRLVPADVRVGRGHIDVRLRRRLRPERRGHRVRLPRG